MPTTSAPLDNPTCAGSTSTWPRTSGTPTPTALVGRDAFLAQIAKPSSVKDIRPHDVEIRLFGDYAVIHARTSYQKPDGTAGSGRYTDDWHRQGGRWRCVSAHVSRF